VLCVLVAPWFAAQAMAQEPATPCGVANPPVPRRRCIGVAGKDGRVLLICGRAPSNSETGRWGLKLTSIGSVTGGLSAPRKQRLGERELSATASRRSSKVACYPLIWIKVAALRANGTAERQEA
jgi:hypothetical protein